jgi:hypothetical protein
VIGKVDKAYLGLANAGLSCLVGWLEGLARPPAMQTPSMACITENEFESCFQLVQGG